MQLSEKAVELLIEYRAAREKWLGLAASKGFKVDEIAAAREATEEALTAFGIRCHVEYELSQGEEG